MMEIRFFRKDEKEKLLSAINTLWSNNHVYVRRPEVLEHLTLNTPYRSDFCGDENYSFLGMLDNGKVVGLYGLIPLKANIFGKEYNASTATIWKIDPDSKANGMDFLKYYYEKDIAFSVTTGLSWMSMAIYKGLGWYTFDDLPRWVAICDLETVIKDLLPLDCNADVLPIARVSDFKSSYKIEIDNLIKETWDSYYNENFAPVSVGVRRDYEFLHWRYENSPVLKYHILTVEDENRDIHGLAVIRIESILNGTRKIGRILEFISLGAEPSIELANAILNFEKDVVMWDFYCLSDITSFGLEMVGFRKIPQWMDQVIMPTRFQPVDYEHMQINGAIYFSKKFRRKINPTVQQLYVTKGDADQDRAN